ncbi:hypothetical protein [Streptomyces sp. NPDC047525]|uniref:hypothetical protein n=1 Tax=Streptomyces sp. NPDC047525 TaxID=3155264 RepID=UPI003404304A
MATTHGDPRKPGHRSSDAQPKPCADCDPNGLDTLKCDAEGVKKQAEVTTSAAAKLAERRTKYDAARAKYTQAREDAAKVVEESGVQLAQLLERLKCTIDDERIVTRMKRAHQSVQAKLEECGAPGGCCADDECDFDANTAGVALSELYARRADIGRHTTQAEKCFDDLIGEPEELTKRTTAIKDELAKISEAMGKGEKGYALVRLYARLLVVKQWLIDVWRGFSSSNDYVNCLCKALTCSLKGWQALAVIEGAIAKAECQEEAAEDRCAELQQSLVEELLAEYSKLLKQGGDGEDDDQS